MFRISVTAVVCLLATAAGSQAQERMALSDATARALARNHAIRVEREEVAASEGRIVGAQGEYDSRLRFDVGFRNARNPITSVFSGAPEGSLAPSYNAFESGVSLSKLFKSGAVATASTSIAHDGTNDSLILFDPAYTTSLGVDLRQPLLRNRAIDPARAALRVTALDRDRSSAALATQVLQTVSQVEAAYWQLVAARRDVDVHRGTVALAERQREETQIRVKGGAASPSDVAQPTAEVERRRGDLLIAQESVARAERALKELIAEDASDPLWSIEIIPADVPDGPATKVDLVAALNDAEEHRPELTGNAAEISQREVDVELAHDALKPNVDLILGYTVRGLSGSQNPLAIQVPGVPSTFPPSLDGGLGSSWGSLGSHDFHDAYAGVQVDIPLGKRSARGQVGVAEANRRRAHTERGQLRNRIGMEVRNAVTALETATGRIQAARAGLVAAETQLKAEQDRFEVGLTSNFFVLTRQNDLATAQLTEIAALTSYRQALTELRRATGTLLRERSIEFK
jgi:outer membrane protein TolC